MIKKKFSSPDKDAGWGLIYRLNNLWAQVDPKATGGDYEGWNFVLDRIYCNLLYDKEMIIKKVYKCEYGHIFSSFKKRKECPKCRKSKGIKSEIKVIRINSIELSEEDKIVYEFLTDKIETAINGKIKAMKSEKKIYEGKSIENYKKEYYQALMMKDIWIRKFMQELKLYLKVVERDPSSAMMGGG